MNPLVTVTELAAELSSPEPPVVLDARWYLSDSQRGPTEARQGHLPGSLFVPVEVFAGPKRPGGAGGRHPLPDRAALQHDLWALGLSSDSRVVVLDQGPSLAAARVWWLLRDAGVDDVRVLDGGFAAWIAAGGEITQEPTPVPGAGDIEVGEPRLPTVDADQVAAAVAAGRRVVDVRAADRHHGENETIDPVAGHIPGAENIPATTLQHPDGAFLPADQLAERLHGLGEGDVFSCGSGITACLALLATEAAGISGVAIYPGSWSDWISDPTRPVATR